MNKLISLMTFAILLFALLVHATVHAAGTTLVQKNLQTQHTSSNAVSFLSSVTTGDTILVAVTQWNASVLSVTDTRGDSFTSVAAPLHANSSSDYVQLYYAKNVTGGTTTIMVSFSSVTDTNVGIYEYAGLDTLSPLDQVTSATGRGISPNGGSLTTALDNDIYFAAGVDDYGNNAAATAGSGYTLENHQDDSNTHERFYTEDRVSPHGTYQTNFSLVALSNWAVIGVALKPASSPTPTLTPSLTPVPTVTPLPTLSPTPTPVLNPGPAHTVVVIEENHQLQQLLGTDYFTSLASQGALMVQSFALTHPSQPNYFALFSGSTQGITDDTCPPPGSPFSTDNLGAQLLAKGLTFGTYNEDMPSVQTTCSSGFYAAKHNPWVFFSNIPSSLNKPMTAFPATPSALPIVSFVIPNVMNDAHDGTVKQASDWLKTTIENYRAWAMTNNSLLLVTTDEDDDAGTNLIYTVFVGPMIKPGIYNEPINHYTVLSTLEDLYKLPHIASASGITDIFK